MFLASDMHIALEAVLLKLHAKLAPGWVLIWVNIDPVQEIGSKVGGGRSFTRLWYKYCSLTIERHGWSTLQACQRQGWALFQVFLHLTMKERPYMYVYTNSLPTYLLISWTNDNIQQSCGPWKHKFWQHTTLWMAKRHREDGIASECGPISQLWCKATLQ